MKVAMVLRMSGAAGRDILSGVFHFTRMHPNWLTRPFQMPREIGEKAYHKGLADPRVSRRRTRRGLSSRCRTRPQ